jgi:hypothetical protein
MCNDLSRKECGVEFIYAVHIAKTTKVNILARYLKCRRREAEYKMMGQRHLISKKPHQS